MSSRVRLVRMRLGRRNQPLLRWRKGRRGRLGAAWRRDPGGGTHLPELHLTLLLISSRRCRSARGGALGRCCVSRGSQGGGGLRVQQGGARFRGRPGTAGASPRRQSGPRGRPRPHATARGGGGSSKRWRGRKSQASSTLICWGAVATGRWQWELEVLGWQTRSNTGLGKRRTGSFRLPFVRARKKRPTPK
jgi:hypothetical protein